MTIGDLLEIYIRNHVSRLKTSRQTQARLERYVGQLAHMPLNQLKRLPVIEWFHTIGKEVGHSAANNALMDLRALYERAGDWELYDGRNPTHRIRRFPKRSRERFVQSEELPKLLAAIQQENPRTAVYFLTLLLTGARGGEARMMQWAHLDLDRALWFKPTTKTGVSHTVPLPQLLVTRLRELPRLAPWVFPPAAHHLNHEQPGLWSRTAVRYWWRKIRTRAGLLDVRIHDLRRTCASHLAINGANLPVIQRTLNHASLQSTQVYARLSLAPVRQALDEQAERMLGPLAPAVPSSKLSEVAPAIRPEAMEEWPG